MKPLQAIALAFLTGCGTLSTNEAISAHNVYRQLLIEASSNFSPVHSAAHTLAMRHEKEADYVREMAPYNGVVQALRAGKEAEQAIHDALSQCIARDEESCGAVRVGFACAASALSTLSESYGQVPGGSAMFAAAAVAEQQLRTLADNASCPVWP